MSLNLSLSRVALSFVAEMLIKTNFYNMSRVHVYACVLCVVSVFVCVCAVCVVCVYLYMEGCVCACVYSV